MMSLENAWVSSPHQDGGSCVGRGVLHSRSACCSLAVSTGHTCCSVDPQGSEVVSALTLVTPWDRGRDYTAVKLMCACLCEPEAAVFGENWGTGVSYFSFLGV